jgi:hypothetical protein
MIACLFILWWLSGSASFIWWWTKDYDFTQGEIIICFFSGFLGPLSFFAGWGLHGGKSTIIKRRKSK